MDENDYTQNAAGIDARARDQVESVAALMDATTRRLELSSRRLDSYAKWFAALVTLILGVSTVLLKTQSDQIISGQNRELEVITSRLEFIEKENAALNERLDNLRAILLERDEDNADTVFRLMEELSRERPAWE